MSNPNSAPKIEQAAEPSEGSDEYLSFKEHMAEIPPQEAFAIPPDGSIVEPPEWLKKDRELTTIRYATQALDSIMNLSDRINEAIYEGRMDGGEGREKETAHIVNDYRRLWERRSAHISPEHRQENVKAIKQEAPKSFGRFEIEWAEEPVFTRDLVKDLGVAELAYKVGAAQLAGTRDGLSKVENLKLLDEKDDVDSHKIKTIPTAVAESKGSPKKMKKLGYNNEWARYDGWINLKTIDPAKAQLIRKGSDVIYEAIPEIVEKRVDVLMRAHKQ
ncbi:hypothetical protein IKF73_03025 [Candidatus Saccharibacteria bacterium]|nr:hypothetical protein [Candidatus Saccharibacteria bacterium]